MKQISVGLWPSASNLFNLSLRLDSCITNERDGITSKTILIISSDYTGHGHKSITESLSECFSMYGDVKLHVVDGFSLGGAPLLRIGKSYGPITRTAKDLWKFVWDVSSVKPSLINELISLVIKENLLQLLDEVKPDLILSVHPNFNGSVIDILEKNNIKVPFVTLIADLVSIYPLWADPRVDYIISPTQEAKDKCIEYGVDESKIKVFGFPVRSRFAVDHSEDYESKVGSKDTPLNCLIMSGGEGSGNMRQIARILLENFNCTVKIVAGRNAGMRKRLEKVLGERYGDKVEIYGFVKDIQDLMMSSDIAFTRGSPNVMMEAISCNIPLVITGALPGQEEGNPEYAEEHDLGVVCKDIKDLKSVIDDLLENDAEKLKHIKHSQKSYSNPEISKNIAQFLLNI